MRVQFTATFDDLVDVTVRAVKRSQPRRNQRWPTLIAASGAAGVTMFAVSGDPFGLALGAASVGLIFGVLLFWPLESRMRNWLKPSMGTEPFEVTVELTPDGLGFTQKNTRTLHEWPIVEAIEESGDAIYFHGRHAQMLAVRNRAFATPEARTQFLELARTYQSAARQ